ncbi:MAG: hypothetical protein IJ776_05990 [Paludibacteraceae bacterium]|nr:hypothetical protein [Paludibacteraceae bacterium]
MNIPERIFNYYRRKHKREQHSFPKWEMVQTILLLFESDLTEKNLQIKQLVKELQQDGKDVTAWGYVDSKNALSAILRDYRILSRRDTNLFNKPKDAHLKDLRRMHFNLVIDLSLHEVLPIKYLMLYADADFKAGRQTDEPYLSDFMVMTGDSDDPAFLYDQILYYIKNIKSND